MSVAVRRASAQEPGALALVRESHALMASLFAPESNHPLSPEALEGGDVLFFAADDGEEILGVGALALRDGYGEVKAMFTAPAARGRGVAEALLARIEQEASARALPLLRLETGDVLHAARRLYARCGFAECGPFGAYGEDPRSVFMEKRLG